MRLRIRSTKLGKIRFVGHRDMARIWDRTLRRLGIPVAFTSGFTPRPRISFGLALPMGAESLAEYVDIDLDDHFDDHFDTSTTVLDDLPAEMSALLPDGVDITAVNVVDRRSGSLQEIVTSCTWALWPAGLHDHHDHHDHRAHAGPTDDPTTALQLLARDQILVERERKRERRTDDVRPLILDLRVADGRLVADLATTGRALRPSELSGLAFPNTDPHDVRVLRINQWTSHDGARREVLPPRAQPVTAGPTGRTHRHDRTDREDRP